MMHANELLANLQSAQWDEATSIFAGDESPIDWLADSTELAALRNQETQFSLSAERAWIGPVEPIQGQTIGV